MSDLGPPVDVRWLQARLTDHLWREDELQGHVLGVRMIHRRRSIAGDIKSLYRVTLLGYDHRRLEQTYVGCELPATALHAEYESWRSKASIVPALGRAVVEIPEANLLLIAFPNNRQMRAFTSEDLVAWLAEHATMLVNRRRRGPHWQLEDAETHVMQYHPGQRLTVRCRGLFVTDDGVQQPFGYIAKQFRKQKRARSVYRNLVCLRKLLNGSSEVRLPHAVAFDDETGLIVMEELAGTELECVLNAVDLDRVMRDVGRMLATFHQIPRRVRKTISRRGELDKVRSAAKTIGGVVPGALQYVDACASRCRDLRWVDDTPSVLLHGSYRPKHVLIDGNVPGLIDVDGIRMGHPAYDLGEFLASLYFLEAQERITPVARRAAAQQFLAGYGAHARWQPPPVAVLWFLAALLLHKHARKQAQRLDEDREKRVFHLLILAETALRGCEEVRDAQCLETIWSVLP